MQAIAIIVEYNPLHNGHLYHLATAKKRFPEAVVIAILNGNFLQRGEPALLDKYTRTRWALTAGIDLVVELPFAFGTQRADIFARGAVTIADGLGATALVYGSEQQTAKDATLASRQPNEKLAFFYEQAITAQQLQLKPVPIKRIHADYDQSAFVHPTIASATAIRQAIFEQRNDTIIPYVPADVSSDINRQREHLAQITQYFPYLQYTLTQRELPPTALAQFGLAENITKALERSTTFSQFFAHVHHKHTSKTHIQRVLTYRLCQTTQQLLDEATKTIWTRVLGSSTKGKQYLKHLKVQQRSKIALIPKINDLPPAHYQLQYNSLIAYAQITQTSIAQTLIQENNTQHLTS